jgi:GrpB protein
VHSQILAAASREPSPAACQLLISRQDAPSRYRIGRAGRRSVLPRERFSDPQRATSNPVVKPRPLPVIRFRETYSGGGMEKYGAGSIVVSDYDPNWPTLFEQERTRIKNALGSFALAIEHMGSTAVPGLPSKPIIDLLIGVPLRLTQF